MEATTMTRREPWRWALHEFSKPAVYAGLGIACIHWRLDPNSDR